MGSLKTILQCTLLALCILPTSFCSGAEYFSPNLVLVGSTPGDDRHEIHVGDSCFNKNRFHSLGSKPDG